MRTTTILVALALPACSVRIGKPDSNTASAGESAGSHGDLSPCARAAIAEGMCEPGESHCLEYVQKGCDASREEHERQQAWERAQQEDAQRKREAKEQALAEAEREREAERLEAERVRKLRDEFASDCRAKAAEFGEAWAEEQAKTWTAEAGAVCSEPSAEFIANAQSAAEEKRARAEVAARRRAFVAESDETLLARGRAGDEAFTAGDDDVVLVLRSWSCSRQFLYKFVKRARAGLRKLGFQQVDCENDAGQRWYEHVEQEAK